MDESWKGLVRAGSKTRPYVHWRLERRRRDTKAGWHRQTRGGHFTQIERLAAHQR